MAAALRDLSEPLLPDSASTEESERLRDLAIESKARHEAASASAGTRHMAHEALFRNGEGYAYTKHVPLDVRALREMIQKPDPHTIDSELEYSKRLGFWQELQQAHHAKHLWPVPEQLRALLKKLLVLLMIFAVICTVANLSHSSASHADAEATTEHEAEASAHDQAAGDGTHAHARFAEAQVKVLLVVLLIAATLLFETLKATLEHEIPREMRAVLSQIFAEFTVLGFLAMTAYFVVQSKALATFSELLYGDEEELDHVFERIHFDIFFVMLAFATLALWLMACTFHAHKMWMSYERFAELHACAIDPEIAGGQGAAVVHRQRIQLVSVEVLYCQMLVASSPLNLIRRMRLAEAREQLQYVLLRDRFVRLPFGSGKDEKPGDEFELHSYLLTTTCEQVRDAIELSLTDWVRFSAVVIPILEVMQLFPSASLLLLLFSGVGLLVAERLLHVLLRGMLDELTQYSPLLHDNMLHTPGADPLESAAGIVSYVPLPPYLRQGHWTGSACGPCANGAHRTRWNRQQALYDQGSRLGWYWLIRLADWLDIGHTGGHIIEKLTSLTLLCLSVYLVAVYEVALSGAGPAWAAACLLPVAVVIIIGMPNVVNLFAYVDSIEMHRSPEAIQRVHREARLKRGLRLLKFLYQLRHFASRRTRRASTNSGGGVLGRSLRKLHGSFASVKDIANELASSAISQLRNSSFSSLASSSNSAAATPEQPELNNQLRRLSARRRHGSVGGNLPSSPRQVGSAGNLPSSLRPDSLTHSPVSAQPFASAPRRSAILADTNRRHAWRECFEYLETQSILEYLDMQSIVGHDSRVVEQLRGAYLRAFGDHVPGLSEGLTSQPDEGGRLSFIEFALFLSAQEVCIPNSSSAWLPNTYNSLTLTTDAPFLLSHFSKSSDSSTRGYQSTMLILTALSMRSSTQPPSRP